MPAEHLQLVLEAIAAGGALLSVYVALSTKLAVAQLEAKLTDKQAERCKECARLFVTRRECDLACGRAPAQQES